MPQLEGPTTKNIQLCTGGFGEKKEKIKSLKKKKENICKRIVGMQKFLLNFNKYWFLFMSYLCLKLILTFSFILLIDSFLCSNDDPGSIKSDLPSWSVLTD